MTSFKHHVIATVTLAMVSVTACDNGQAPAPLVDSPTTAKRPTELKLGPTPAALTPRVRRQPPRKSTSRGGPPAAPFPVNIPSLPAAPTADLPPPVPAPRPSQSERREVSRVIVYGADWCRPCQDLKVSLRERGIPFVFIDMDDKTAMSSAEGRLITEMPANLRGAIPATRVVRPIGAVTWVSGNNAHGVEAAYRGNS
ncbi:MAG: hypothetical protein IT377_13335 [Polyangiaceae bacterium]|nr:hypothetical protein [Polyangiaceae bacterium]